MAGALGQANRDRLLEVSCRAQREEPEQIVTPTWDQSGWYYLLVTGHNGANDPSTTYTLQISLTEGTQEGMNFQVPLFDPPQETQPDKKTLILTHRTRLFERYGPEQSNILMNKLDQLSNHPQVAGAIIDLNTYHQFDDLYDSWDNHITDTLNANYVAASIKALLTTVRGAYPDLEQILIVGNDDIIPFRRIADEVPLANERTYHVEGDSALAASTKEGYLLSDDYYASFNPEPYRGRGLFLPEYAIGRLVETPEEMTTAIESFLESPVLTVTTGLVTGYDFLTDQAEAIEHQMQQMGVTVSPLISDSWQASDLQRPWLGERHDLNSINAHFTHQRALPADRSGGDLSAAEVKASPHLTGTVVFSVGCHSGLPVPGSASAKGQLDFAQVLVGKGATYLANTGFGYGDANVIGYSEQLMQRFTHQLQESTTVGQALRQAKTEYFNTIGLDALTPYDEKVLAVATFYGFPMYKIHLPNAEQSTTANRGHDGAQLSPPSACAEGLICRQATFTPQYTTHKDKEQNDTYFSIEGETQQIPGQPILPRTNLTILETSITNTLAITVARGAIFEGGHYDTFQNFNPVITHIITENTVHNPTEPRYFADGWRPAEWDLINSVRTTDKVTQKLVVMPAQYRPNGPWQDVGVARRFIDMTYTIYYSTTRDTIPPSIWKVDTSLQQFTEPLVEVEATDFSGVVRTVATYTTGEGIWQSVDLTQNPDEPDRWQGNLPQHPDLAYFIQAVDSGGNVAIDDNKGRYFESLNLNDPASFTTYLPLIIK